MCANEPQNRDLSEAETPIPYEITRERLRTRLSNSIAPLALEVDCLTLKHWAENIAKERFRLNLLVKELDVWSKLLSSRPVNRIWLRHPLSLMDAPTLTELVFAINKHFKVSTGHRTEFAVSVDSNFNRQDLALLRGLGCNHLQVVIPPVFDLEKINAAKDSISDLGFTYMSFELPVNTDPSHDSLHIMECLSFLSPTSLRLRAEPLDLSNLEQLTPMLMQFGYSFQLPNTILKFGSPLNNPPDDVLRLGPTNVSQLADLKLIALKTPSIYQDFLNKDQVPIFQAY